MTCHTHMHTPLTNSFLHVEPPDAAAIHSRRNARLEMSGFLIHTHAHTYNTNTRSQMAQCSFRDVGLAVSVGLQASVGLFDRFLKLMRLN